jgi:hypothetical protein
MRYIFAQSLSALILSAAAVSAATLGQQTIPLSSTATTLSCSGQRYVNKLTVRVIPGFEGKVYVGIAGMNPAVYANTLAVLFPNLGAHSEEYVVQDPSGDDGIDLCSIYVAGEIPGENAVAEYVTNNSDGSVAPTYLLTPTLAGFYLSSLFDMELSYISVARMQAVPGQPSGESFALFGNPYYEAGDAGFLSPNAWILAQHNAWSELFEVSDPVGNNSINGNAILDPALDASQGVIASVWAKQTLAGIPETSSLVFNTIGIPLFLSGVPSLPLNDGTIYEAKFTYGSGTSVAPVYVGDCTAANAGLGNFARALYPTLDAPGSTSPIAAFHESLSFGSRAFNSSGICFSDSDAGSLSGVFMTGLLLYAGTPPAPLAAAAQHTGAVITPANAGTPINLGNVKHLVVSVTIGQEGKMFIGSATMDTSTLDGVYAILYPNAGDENGVGRWSETLELDDPEGDGIPTNSLYIQSEIPGESVLVSSTTTGVAPADGVLNVIASGALSGSFSSYAVPFAPTSTPISILRAQAVPGGAGKLFIGTSQMTAAQPDPNYANTLKVLWPSQGDYNVGEGWSERFIETCHTGPVNAPNCLDLQNFTFWPELPWEQLLVFAMGR